MKTFLARQRQAGFFAIRFKSAAGKFTAAQLTAVNDLAERFGNGTVNLTSRQELSIPFVRKEDFDAIKAFADAHELVISPIGMIFKQVTACQGTQSCLAGIINSPAVAMELERRYGGRELPCKLTCSVTGCPNNCMKVNVNDLGIQGAVEPQFVAENCIHCGACAKVCPVGAITIDRKEKLWAIDRAACINCGRCVGACKKAALDAEVGYKIYFVGQTLLPLIKDEATLYKTVDATLEYFTTHAKTRERLSKLFVRLGTAEFLEALRRAAVSGGSRLDSKKKLGECKEKLIVKQEFRKRLANRPLGCGAIEFRYPSQSFGAMLMEGAI